MDINPLIKALIEKLFEPEKRRLNAAITDMNRDNKELKSLKVDGFMYGGKFYLPLGISTMVNGPGVAKSTLHNSLWKQMDRWILDNKTVQGDHILLAQILYRLLKPCETSQDIRDALPECLVTLIPGMSSHSRAEQAGYTLAEDERAARQFHKFLPRMEFYSATRLLY